MSSIFVDDKQKLQKEVDLLKKELNRVKVEKKELLQNYNDLKKRYNNVSREISLLLCEVRENKNDNNRS